MSKRPHSPPPSYDDVVRALNKLMHAAPGDDDKTTKGRAACYKVLALYGRGVRAVRDLKPVYYGDVIRGCDIEAERLLLEAVVRNSVNDNMRKERDAAVLKIAFDFFEGAAKRMLEEIADDGLASMRTMRRVSADLTTVMARYNRAMAQSDFID